MQIKPTSHMVVGIVKGRKSCFCCCCCCCCKIQQNFANIKCQELLRTSKVLYVKSHELQEGIHFFVHCFSFLYWLKVSSGHFSFFVFQGQKGYSQLI